MVNTRYAALQRTPSVALDRTGRPSRDSDPPAPGRLPKAPLLGMARADAVRLATAVSACVASEGGRRRQGPLSGRGDAGMRFRWPGPTLAGPRVSPSH